MLYNNSLNKNFSQERKHQWDLFKNEPRQDATGSTGDSTLIDFGVKLLKTVTIIVTFIVVLGSAITSKGTLLFMTSQLKKNTTRLYCNKNIDTKQQFIVTLTDEERAVWIWVIIFSYMVPEAATLFRSIRIIFFKSWNLPTLAEFFSVFISESLSAIGSALLVFVVFPELDVIKGAMLTKLCVLYLQFWGWTRLILRFENKFLKKFTPSKLPGESQWNLSRCFQRLDEEVSSFCTRLRIIGAKLLREDLSGATPEEEAGIRKRIRSFFESVQNRLRKDLMKETGVLLLREENLDLEKAENLGNPRDHLLMMQGRMSNMKISTVETERVCYTCGKPGHLAREGRRTKSTQPMGSNVCFSCNHEGHWARDCPRNAPEEHKPGSQNFGRRFQGASGPPPRNWDHLHGIGDHLHEIGTTFTELGPPPRNWGPPMARARDNQAREQMGREEMGHLQCCSNGDRNDFPHQVFPGMKRTKGS
ncbi:hypothetical protein JTB14_021888 [Gonioctena quinquepunctata]|nr:hypothetical protein JTB14_021888 [Gonioctena quinquepunctata]